MCKFMLVGCDLHDRTMLLRFALDSEAPLRRVWKNDPPSRQKMIEDLQDRAAAVGARVIFGYEASGSGFVLWDELTAAGIHTDVLAPTRMKKSPRHSKQKCDDRDALAVLELLRGHYLAGNELPTVWVPPLSLRQDRELVRQRLSMREDAGDVKRQIRWLLKRNGYETAPAIPWTKGYFQWLDEVQAQLPFGPAQALGSMQRQLEFLLEECGRLESAVLALARQPRYAPVVEALCREKGIGELTAMVFLLEMGDFSRFTGRRGVGAYFGLTPASHDSGEDSDRKGHITKQGPSRIRKVLCQAVWSRLKTDPHEQEAYARIVRRNPRHKKIAVVARMRALGVRLWHVGLAAQQAAAAAMASPPPEVAAQASPPARRSDQSCPGPERLSHQATGSTTCRPTAADGVSAASRAGGPVDRPCRMAPPRRSGRSPALPCPPRRPSTA